MIDIWCHALVISILKASKPASFSNYRAISVLPFLSKVLWAHSIWISKYIFMHNNNILSSFESVFRPEHSTITTINKICDDIRYSFYNAFNTVDYDILLAILKSTIFSSKAKEWFSSYLYGCRQRTLWVCLQLIKLDG